ncbi:hypothetical protein F5Y04DRAFT_288830 [Hypomontagnella monticulosa]|nr:hypothetical protein F5Y04DRAFT_288830 [Hypomontagnella monticulosa]
MVFRNLPGMTRPRSLRDYLMKVRLNSLSQKFSVAQQLAKAISYFHVFGFVHKNVRPETVLVFEDQGKESHSAFLVGFEDFRREEGDSARYGDAAPERNLYHHPTRQGINPKWNFIMQNDIYSLGVCLLEIGLWQSFVHYKSHDEPPTLSGIFGVGNGAMKKEVMGFQIMGFLQTSAKERFIQISRSRLRKRMGTQYSRIVETCLTCLDPDNNDFGDEREFEDEDGICIGVRFIEKVLQRLNSLNV